MQDAKEWRWPPSIMFGIKPNRRAGKLTKLDVLLAEGLRLYEDSLCRGCGVPAGWAWDQSAETARQFVLDPDAPQCKVCELLEAPPDNEEDRRQPGEKVRVLNQKFDIPDDDGGGRDG